MAEFFEELNEQHRAMIEAQPVFFVATAVESARINLSPKGYDAFRILSPCRVAYLDLGGSGNETNAPLGSTVRCWDGLRANTIISKSIFAINFIGDFCLGNHCKVVVSALDFPNS